MAHGINLTRLICFMFLPNVRFPSERLVLTGSPATLSLGPSDGPSVLAVGGTPRRAAGGGGGDSDTGGVDSGSFNSRRRWRTRLRPEWRDRRSEGGVPPNNRLYDTDVKSTAAAAGVAAATPKEAVGTSSPSPDDSIEGFICPQCRMKLSSPAALLAHFHVFHGSGVGGGGTGGGGAGVSGRGGGGAWSGDEERGAAGPERPDDEGGGEGGGWDSSGRSGNRRGSKRPLRRGSWRGASISLDHFILALQSFMEEHPDEGNVMAR